MLIALRVGLSVYHEGRLKTHSGGLFLVSDLTPGPFPISLTVMELVLLAGLAFAVSLLLNLICTPVIITFANRYKLFDRLNARKIHTGNISRLAGIGIFVAFAGGSLIVWLFWIPAVLSWSLVLALAGSAMVFTIGLVDDFYELRARYKLVVQIMAALSVVVGGFVFAGLDIPGLHIGFGFSWFGQFLTFCWVLGIINAINLIDGMDGLAGGASFFASLAMGIIFFLTGRALQGTLALALAGALAGFLCFNRPKAKIFMGDGGAYFLGFMLAFLPLIDTAPSLVNTFSGAGFVGGRIGVVHAVTLVLLPIGDTLAAIIRRKRKGQKFTQPDRHHMHHKMLNMGFSTWQILGVVSMIEIALAVAAIFDILIGSTLSAIVLVASWVLVFGFFVYLDRAQYKSIPK